MSAAKHILLAAALTLALAAPALAEVVTLQCAPAGTAALVGTGPYAMDVDMTARAIVSFGTTTKIDQVTDRYIYYAASQAPDGRRSTELDRKTGFIQSRRVGTNFWNTTIGTWPVKVRRCALNLRRRTTAVPDPRGSCDVMGGA